MRLHVAFHPTLLLTGALDPVPVVRPQVCVVVDVLRASTSLVTLVERGADVVYIAPSVAVARARKGELPRVVMAGEEGGLAPEGFDYGNSPVELSAAEVRGRPVVFVTTNGTAAIRAVARLGPVLVGAMRNGAAAAAEAFRLARAAGSDVTVVCAGREGGFGLDDAYCAGYLTSRLLEHGQFDLTDGAEAALLLYRSEPDAMVVFLRAAAGRNVVRLGLRADVSYCAQRDRSSAVPTVGRELRLMEETDPEERRQEAGADPAGRMPGRNPGCGPS